MEGTNYSKKSTIILSIIIILLLAVIIGMCIYLNTLTTTSMDSNNPTSPLQSGESTLGTQNQVSNIADVDENIVTVSNLEANNANTSISNEQNIFTQQVTLNGKNHTLTINATAPEKVSDYNYTTTCTIQFDSKIVKILEDFYCWGSIEDLKLIVCNLEIIDNQFLVIPMKELHDTGRNEYFYFINDKGEILSSINTYYGTSVTFKNDEELDGFKEDDDIYTLYKIEGNSFIWIQESVVGRFINSNILASKYKLNFYKDFSPTLHLEDTYDSSEVELAGKV